MHRLIYFNEVLLHNQIERQMPVPSVHLSAPTPSLSTCNGLATPGQRLHLVARLCL